jgi:hypothetical protein
MTTMKIFSKGTITFLPWLLVCLLGFATGCAMTGLGLVMRIGDVFTESWLTAWFGVALFKAIGLTAGRIGWMLVLEGIFLVAALCAFAVHNHWGWWSMTAAGLLSIIFFPGGTLAGIIVLAALGVRLIREKPWKKAVKTGADA